MTPRQTPKTWARNAEQPAPLAVGAESVLAVIAELDRRDEVEQ